MDFTKFETNEAHHDTVSVANSAAHSALIFDSYHMQSQESFIANNLIVKFQLNRNSGSVIVDLPQTSDMNDSFANDRDQLMLRKASSLLQNTDQKVY